MGKLTEMIFKAGLDSLYYTRAYQLFSPLYQGQGFIYMLHQVNDDPINSFAPNQLLTLTPDFLDRIISLTKAQNIDFVTMDEAKRRILSDKQERRFAVLTLDDAYRDNLVCAKPVFDKHNVPYVIYVASDYCSGKGELWWLLLEKVIQEQDEISFTLNGQNSRVSTKTIEMKYAAFDQLYHWCRQVDNHVQRAFIRSLCEKYNVDIADHTSSYIMTWDELRSINKSELVTLGAHTKSHYAISKLSKSDVCDEVADGVAVMEKELGETPRHFAYPYGDPTSASTREFQILREMGFQTSVTTRKGLIYAAHKEHMHGLPRLSLNGLYQQEKYVKALMSGVPFALFNKGRKLNVS